MTEEPECFRRKCRHFIGVKQDNQDELTERVICEAYPDGIPEVIAFGENLHLSPVDGDNGIQFEKIS